jgi:hypothetical protein
MNFGKPQGEGCRPFRPLEFFVLAGRLFDVGTQRFQFSVLYTVCTTMTSAENQHLIRAHYDNPLQERVRL